MDGLKTTSGRAETSSLLLSLIRLHREAINKGLEGVCTNLEHAMESAGMEVAHMMATTRIEELGGVDDR